MMPPPASSGPPPVILQRLAVAGVVALGVAVWTVPLAVVSHGHPLEALEALPGSLLAGLGHLWAGALRTGW